MFVWDQWLSRLRYPTIRESQHAHATHTPKHTHIDQSRNWKSQHGLLLLWVMILLSRHVNQCSVTTRTLDPWCSSKIFIFPVLRTTVHSCVNIYRLIETDPLFPGIVCSIRIVMIRRNIMCTINSIYNMVQTYRHGGVQDFRELPPFPSYPIIRIDVTMWRIDLNSNFKIWF